MESLIRISFLVETSRLMKMVTKMKNFEVNKYMDDRK